MEIKNNSRKVRKTRSDKKAKILINISEEDHQKLIKLSKATDKPKSTLSAEFVSMCINHMDIINWLMEKYNTDENYRVIPVKQNGKVIY